VDWIHVAQDRDKWQALVNLAKRGALLDSQEGLCPISYLIFNYDIYQIVSATGLVKCFTLGSFLLMCWATPDFLQNLYHHFHVFLVICDLRSFLCFPSLGISHSQQVTINAAVQSCTAVRTTGHQAHSSSSVCYSVKSLLYIIRSVHMNSNSYSGMSSSYLDDVCMS
jgi:hypothetical protein